MTHTPTQSPTRRPDSPHGANSNAGVLLPKMSHYILRTLGLHQICLSMLTVIVFLMEVIPLELQRRIVNDTVKHRHFQAIVTLCAVYAGVALAQGAIKLGLNVYRSWLGERTTRDLRKRICDLYSKVRLSSTTNESGIAISMIVAEAEPIGLFVAEAVSEPLLQCGIVASVLAYMIHVDPIMTLITGVVFLAQFTFLPLMQAAINQRTQKSISLLRGLSGSLADRRSATTDRDGEGEVIDRVFGLSVGIFKLKYSLNFLMNLGTHWQIIIALLYGGWLVLTSQLEIGGVVAFISGITRLTDPWGDLVNYYRDVSLTKVKYDLLVRTVNQIAERHRADDPAH